MCGVPHRCKNPRPPSRKDRVGNSAEMMEHVFASLVFHSASFDRYNYIIDSRLFTWNILGYKIFCISPADSMYAAASESNRP